MIRSAARFLVLVWTLTGCAPPGAPASQPAAKAAVAGEGGPARPQEAAPSPADLRFEGEPTSWHEGFSRYDFLLDDTTLAITPLHREPSEGLGIPDPPAGHHRCVVVVPRAAAAGRPWSWRGCYWNHQPQAEVELLRRGFHIAYISANAGLRPGREWDAWYEFLTARHGLSKKPAFVGMSRGGEYAYTWGLMHPDRVSCIYADNPGGSREMLGKVGLLAAQDVPLLHVCGSIDPLLGRVSAPLEAVYRELGGRISVMIKEGRGHHPHSLVDPAPIADFIEASQTPAGVAAPGFAGAGFLKSTYSATESQYRFFAKEGVFITCRGPRFGAAYARYSFSLWGVEGNVTVIEPREADPRNPWVFRADFVPEDAAVDQALLSRGFRIVTGPVPYNADGPLPAAWDAVYRHLVEHGFSRKAVLEGAGGAAAEAYVWAAANPEKVACLYAENPILRSVASKSQPLERLEALARAGVPILHECGSLDPSIGESRELERRYRQLGGPVTILVRDGAGHYPLGPADPAQAVDFIVRHAF